MVEIDPAITLEVNSLEDLIHWVVSSSQGQQGTLFYFEKNDKHYFTTFIILPGYYELNGLPLLLVSEHNDAPKSKFLRFDIRKGVEDRISYTDGFDDRDSNLGYIQYLPIVSLKKIPPIFDIPD
ncbi:MAG: hypothetical protein ACXAC7_00020 [Candidatus Hodarchaeales archaeon]|jgi:hypothetical protein